MVNNYVRTILFFFQYGYKVIQFFTFKKTYTVKLC